MEIKTKLNKQGLIKLPSFCTAKETITKAKRSTYRIGGKTHKWCNWQGIKLQNIQIAHTAQNWKNKQPSWKMCRSSKQTFLQRRHEVKAMLLSRVQLFATPWTVAYQAPLSMGFSRQEYWSELPFPSPGNLPDPGIKPRSPALQTDALPSEPPGKPWKWKWKLLSPVWVLVTP